MSELCLESDIILVQEHWQTPANISNILNFSTYHTGYGISAMNACVDSGVLYGRPYGGVAILVRNSLVTHINSILCSERFAIVKYI